MPFPFSLPTTSSLSFQSSLTSSTHPSLPSTSTSVRSIVRSQLKSHKHSPSSTLLSTLAASLTTYLTHLATLDLALSNRPISSTTSSEDVDITLASELEVSWRPSLTQSLIPGRREADRVSGRGLDFEIFFAHNTLALVHALLARQALLGLYPTSSSSSSTLEPAQRLALIQSATKSLSLAHSLHKYLAYRATHSPAETAFPSAGPLDISGPVQSALSQLAAAELNLLAVLKDDPYPGLIAQSRNKDDREWMIKAPTIPKVRAQVLRRLCVGAAENASRASIGLKNADPLSPDSTNKGSRPTNKAISSLTKTRISKELAEYVADLERTARAKACRFAALDADLAGETGTAIAWLRAGLDYLGIETKSISNTTSSTSGISRLKATWTERREDKRIERGSANWGADAGRLEESRILEYLHAKLSRENDTVNVQLVPDWRPLLASMPSGMNVGGDDRWRVAVLGEDELVALRAPPDPEAGVDSSDDDDDEDEDNDDEEALRRRKNHNSKNSSLPVGAYPGTQGDYIGGGSGGGGDGANNYY